MTGPIEAGWKSYLEEAVNPKNSREQIMEMRRVFYAGAMIATIAFSNAADHLDDADRVKAIAAIHSDLTSFQSELNAATQ